MRPPFLHLVEIGGDRGSCDSNRLDVRTREPDRLPTPCILPEERPERRMDTRKERVARLKYPAITIQTRDGVVRTATQDRTAAAFPQLHWLQVFSRRNQARMNTTRTNSGKEFRKPRFFRSQTQLGVFPAIH
jgi:hypothetical protein